jgi:integrase
VTTDSRDPDAYVFVAGKGGPVLHNNFRRREFKPAAAAAGLTRPPTIHDLRHTADSLSILRGASVKQVQELCGHRSSRRR